MPKRGNQQSYENLARNYLVTLKKIFTRPIYRIFLQLWNDSKEEYGDSVKNVSKWDFRAPKVKTALQILQKKIFDIREWNSSYVGSYFDDVKEESNWESDAIGDLISTYVVTHAKSLTFFNKNVNIDINVPGPKAFFFEIMVSLSKELAGKPNLFEDRRKKIRMDQMQANRDLILRRISETVESVVSEYIPIQKIVKHQMENVDLTESEASEPEPPRRRKRRRNPEVVSSDSEEDDYKKISSRAKFDGNIRLKTDYASDPEVEEMPPVDPHRQKEILDKVYNDYSEEEYSANEHDTGEGVYPSEEPEYKEEEYMSDHSMETNRVSFSDTEKPATPSDDPTDTSRRPESPVLKPYPEPLVSDNPLFIDSE